MSFDSKLLDSLAMTFVEAAIQELETQFSAGTAAPGTTMYWQCEHCSGGVLNAAPVTPNFESLTTIRDADLSTPRSSVWCAHYRGRRNCVVRISSQTQ